MKRCQRYLNSTQARTSVLAALTILFLGSSVQSQAQGPAPAAQAVWQHVGRVYLNPDTGAGVFAGYLVNITGISNSLFNTARRQCPRC